jgi:hypothetical protein
MTNPAAAMRMLITYAIGIALAVVVGYLLTNPLDYGTLGFLGVVIALIISPVFIKWHYPIMVFGLGFPATVFFIVGSPPAWEVAVMLSLGIAIVERTLNSEKRFLSAPGMTWALLFTLAMSVATMKLTGGFHLHAVGGEMGGGKKYLTLWLGCATFFALASRGVPPAQRGLYVALFFLPGVFNVVGDLFAILPGSFKYLGLIFPPMTASFEGAFGSGLLRLQGLSFAATAAFFFMAARYGLRGVFSLTRPWRLALFLGLFFISMMGGFRGFFIANLVVLGCVFFLEGLHRTRLMFVAVFLALMGTVAVLTFSDKMPTAIQRTISFLPVKVDPMIRADAEASTEWRLNIWQAILPQVPGYLLLGKGYALSATDYESMGEDNPFAASARVNASLESLAIANDFHSGPLSTLICFGIWGVISILAVMAAGFFITYRNFKYGDPALLSVNAMLLAMHLEHVLHFFFIFGAYADDISGFARIVGFSVALNWGVRGAPAPAPSAARLKPLAAPQTA